MTLAWIALSLLGAALLAPFVLGVPALKKSVRFPAEPRLEPIRVREVDWADRGYFKRRAKDFAEAGFEPLGEYAFEPMEGSVVLLAAHLSGDRRTTGLSMQVANRRVQTLVLQFVSCLPEGISVATSNNRFAPVFRYPPNRILFRHPGIQPLPALLDRHLQNLDLYGSIASARSLDPREVLSWIESSAREERELHLADGLEAREGDSYRLTLKGAIRLSALQWWHSVVGHWFD